MVVQGIYQYGVNMDTFKELQQIFQNNLGNRITVELANGMLDAVLKLIPVIQEHTEPPKQGE